MRLILFLLSSLWFISLSVQAGLYRWVDENGQVHYSDSIPPSGARQGHAELDTEARAIRNIAPVKSAAEIQREHAAAVRAEKLAKEKALREAEDRALIQTFSSVEQIEAMADERLSTIDYEIRNTRRKLDKIKDQLKRTETRRDWFTNNDKPVPEQISANLAELNKQIDIYNKSIARQEHKRAETVSKFVRDRQRYIELQTELSRAK